MINNLSAYIFHAAHTHSAKVKISCIDNGSRCGLEEEMSKGGGLKADKAAMLLGHCFVRSISFQPDCVTVATLLHKAPGIRQPTEASASASDRRHKKARHGAQIGNGSDQEIGRTSDVTQRGILSELSPSGWTNNGPRLTNANLDGIRDPLQLLSPSPVAWWTTCRTCRTCSPVCWTAA